MIRAYHHVRNVPVQGLLQKGAIFPAAFRVNPEALRGLCEWVLDPLEETVEDEGGNPFVVQGLKLLMEDRLRRVNAVSSRETDATGFFCEDLLAGDLFSVFLSTGRWGRGDEEVIPNGFVFDAEALVRRGAAVRLGDLMDGYSGVIEEMPWWDAQSAKEAGERLEKKLEEVKERWELKGEKAVRQLRKNPKEWHEIAFFAPLLVDWAIEVWENGVMLVPSTGRRPRPR